MSALLVDPDQPLSFLQKQFSDLFPYLKIECFKSPHQKNGGSTRRKMHTPETHLRSCMHGNIYGTLSINPRMTVNMLEEHFRKEFNLNIQVFRASGNVWLETTATDSWTLKQQNEEGANSKLEIKQEMESADDHDIY